MLDGSGWAGLNKHTTHIGQNSVSKATYQRYKNFIVDTIVKVTDDHSKDIQAVLFDYYRDFCGIHPEDGILNVEVIYDGSWKTKGYNSNQGGGVVIYAKQIRV